MKKYKDFINEEVLSQKYYTMCLNLAVREMDIDEIKRLLNLGADPDWSGTDNISATYYIIKQEIDYDKGFEIFKIFIERGSELNEWCRYQLGEGLTLDRDIKPEYNEYVKKLIRWLLTEYPKFLDFLDMILTDELKEEFAYLYAANDHDLLGLKKVNENLEHKKFKVGDRIMIAYNPDDDDDIGNLIGLTGTIDHVLPYSESKWPDYYIKIDDMSKINRDRYFSRLGCMENKDSFRVYEAEIDYASDVDQYEEWGEVNESNDEYYVGQTGVLKGLGNISYWHNGLRVVIARLNKEEDYAYVKPINDPDHEEGALLYRTLSKYFEPDPVEVDQYEEWGEVNESNTLDFKVGDTVRCIFDTLNWKDKLCLITKISSDGRVSLIRLDDGYESDYFCDYKELKDFFIYPESSDQYEEWDEVNEEVARDRNYNELHVGDRIEIVLDPAGGNKELGIFDLKGKRGTIVEILDDINIYMVEMDDILNGLKDFIKEEVFDPNHQYHDEIVQYYENNMDKNVIFVWSSVIEVIDDIGTDQYEDWEEVNEVKGANGSRIEIGDFVTLADGNSNIRTLSMDKKYEVINIERDDDPLLTIIDDEGDETQWYAWRFELAQPDVIDQYEEWDEVNEEYKDEEYEVGDRVRITDLEDSGLDNFKGLCGVIVVHDPTKPYPYNIKTDNNLQEWFKSTEFELENQGPVDQYEDWDINEDLYNTFNIGDRVRIIGCDDDNRDNIIGEVGTIVDTISKRLYEVKLDKDIQITDNRGDCKNCWYAYKYEIEPYVEETDQYEDWEEINEHFHKSTGKFKVGDRVIITNSSDKDEFVLIGMHGVVKYIRGNLHYITIDNMENYENIIYSLSNYDVEDNEWICWEDELEFETEADKPDQYEEWEEVNEHNKEDFYVGCRVHDKYRDKDGTVINIGYWVDVEFDEPIYNGHSGNGDIRGEYGRVYGFKSGANDKDEDLAMLEIIPEEVDQYEEWDN